MSHFSHGRSVYLIGLFIGDVTLTACAGRDVNAPIHAPIQVNINSPYAQQHSEQHQRTGQGHVYNDGYAQDVVVPVGPPIDPDNQSDRSRRDAVRAQADATTFAAIEAKILQGARLSTEDGEFCARTSTCRVLRNTVFARHGRHFESADLRSHFRSRSWYRVNPDYSDSLLRPADHANVGLLKQYE
jgi:hypothetical protein